MTRSWIALPLVTVLLAACKSAPERLPAGRGLLAFDRSAPEAAETFAAPRWRVGDRFEYEKAGLGRIVLCVEAIDEGRVTLLDEHSGGRTFVSEELVDLGEQVQGADEPTLALDPGDATFSWPLWVGKRWVSEFTSRAPGRPDVPLLARYECDVRERVTVPAGTFDCLRVWRRVRPAVPGDYLERVSIVWYAPEVGAVVRRLGEGLETELVDFQRQ